MIAHANPPGIFDLIAHYETFRARFQSWSADRQRFVIDVSRDRCKQEPDPEFRDFLASITTDLEFLSIHPTKGGAQ